MQPQMARLLYSWDPRAVPRCLIGFVSLHIISLTSKTLLDMQALKVFVEHHSELLLLNIQEHAVEEVSVRFVA